MNRAAALLMLTLVICALSLVSAQYRARSLFVEHERGNALEKKLNQDWSRLQYDQSSLGKSARIAEVAANQLHMSAIIPGRTQFISAATIANTQTASAASHGGRP